MTPSVWFNILVGLGIAVGVLSVDRLNRSRRADPELGTRADAAVLAMVAAGVVAFAGAIVFAALAEGRVPFAWPWSFAFLGGVLGGSAGLAAAARLLRVPLLPLADHLAVGLAAGHAVGRLGCLAAGCCHGVPCGQSAAFAWLAPFVHDVPVQLLESFAELVNLAVLWWILRRASWRPGAVALAWMALYGIERFLLEFLRGDDRGALPYAQALGLSPSQGVGLLMSGAAISGLLAMRWMPPRSTA